MSSRKLTTLVILSLTILTADLLSEIIVHWLGHYLKTTNPYKATALHMFVSVCVFYPAFSLMEEMVKGMTKSYVGKSKQMAGGGFYGLLVVFVLALLVLFGCYLKVKFGINLLHKLR